MSNFLKVRNGLFLGSLSADPSGASSADGMIYYNSTLKKFRKRRNGFWVNISDDSYAFLVGGGLISWNFATTSIAFSSDIFVERSGLNYSDNKIPVALSPLVLPTANHVAYIQEINVASGGSDLVVAVDLISNLPEGKVIIARRDGADVIFGVNRLSDGDSIKLYQTSTGGADTLYQQTLNNNQVAPAAISNLSLNSLNEKAAVVDYYVSRYHQSTSPTSIDTGFGLVPLSFQSQVGTAFDAFTDQQVRTIQLDSLNNAVMGGNFSQFKGVTRNRLIKISANGVEDSTFSTNLGTGFGWSPSSLGVAAVAIQSDDKIICGGDFSTFQGVSKKWLLRLNSNGTEDTSGAPTFYTNLGTGFNNSVRAVAIQSDGKILVGGDFTTFKGVTRNYIVRLNSDGTEDAGFYTTLIGAGTGFNGIIRKIVVQPDGKILVGGDFSSVSGVARNSIVRLNSTGSVDTSFTSNTINGGVYAIGLQPDSSVLIGGVFTSIAGNTRKYLARLSSSGVDDSSFYSSLTSTGDGTGLNGNPFEIKVNASSEIFVVGGFTTLNGATRRKMIKLNSSGLEMSSFYTALTSTGDGTGFYDVYTPNVYSLAILPDSNMIAVGDFFNFNGFVRDRIVKLGSTGAEYTSAVPTNLGLFFGVGVYSIAKQSDGKMVVGGEFTKFDGNTRNYLVRLNADGTEDTSGSPTFYTNLGTGFNASVLAVTIQPSDGKILVGGNFTTLNGTTRNRLVRLNTDGTVDTSFYGNLGNGFNGSVQSIAVQSDGKILVGGNFTTFGVGSPTRNRLVRLNSSGSEDASFYTSLGTGFDNVVSSIAIQSDGRIVVGGDFTLLNTSSRNRLVRLETSGIEDLAFSVNLGSGFNSLINAVAIHSSNNKIVVGGAFTTFNGNTRNRLIRLNSSGNEDTSFYTSLISAGTGFNNYVLSLKIQSDDKIIVGGGFTLLNGNTRNRLVRLKSTGESDTNFYTPLGTALDNAVSTIELLSDSEIVIGGYFNSISTNSYSRIANINSGLEYLNALIQNGSFRASYRPYENTWELGAFQSAGDDAGVDFSINNSGQGYYTTSNLSGTLIESIIRYKIKKL